MDDDNLPDTANVLPFKQFHKPKVVTSGSKEKRPVDPAVVRLLEDYLHSAKQGRIKFVAIAAVDQDMIAFSTWEPADSDPQLVTASLGAVSYLHHRYNASADEGAEEDNRLRED